MKLNYIFVLHSILIKDLLANTNLLGFSGSSKQAPDLIGHMAP